MSIVRMKTDMKPRCDLHYAGPAMVPVEVYFEVDKLLCSFRAFACQVSGCHRVYDIVHGYFEISDGRISSLGHSRRPCPKDERTVPEDSGMSIYKCSQFGCNESQTVQIRH